MGEESGSHMVNKRRWIVALALCLIWATVVVASFYFLSEVYRPDTFSGWDFLVVVLLSLLFLTIGLVAFSGRIRVFFLLSYPAALIYSEIDTSKYNVEKASFVLGIMTAAFSCVFFLLFISGLMAMVAFCFAITALMFGVIYVFVSKRFRTDARPKY